MKQLAALIAFGIAMQSIVPVYASEGVMGTVVIPVASSGTDAEDSAHRSLETLSGVIVAVDERNDRVTVQLSRDVTTDLKVRDGLFFNAVRYGDPVEVTVEDIDGAKTIVGLVEK